jgi:hypothetical protein
MVTRHLGGRLAGEPQRGTLAKADGGHHLGPDQEAEQPPALPVGAVAPGRSHAP